VVRLTGSMTRMRKGSGMWVKFSMIVSSLSVEKVKAAGASNGAGETAMENRQKERDPD